MRDGDLGAQGQKRAPAAPSPASAPPPLTDLRPLKDGLNSVSCVAGRAQPSAPTALCLPSNPTVASGDGETQPHALCQVL